MTTPVKKLFQAGWSRAWAESRFAPVYSITGRIAKSHSIVWSAPVVGSHCAKWSLRFAKRHSGSYGDLIPLQVRRIFPYSDAARVLVTHTSKYDSLPQLALLHTAPYENVARITWKCIASYAVRAPIAKEVLVVYGDMAIPKSKLVSPYENVARTTWKVTVVYAISTPISKQLLSPYGGLGTPKSKLIAPYESLVPINLRKTIGWNLNANVVKVQSVNYDLLTVDLLRKSMLSGYSLSTEGVQSITGTPTVDFEGHAFRVITATLTCDESSPYWIATLELEHLDDYGLLVVGSLLTLGFSGESFLMVVDGKSMSRSGGGALVLRVDARSELALYDAPFSGVITVAYSEDTLAQTVVEDRLGPVTWLLPSWSIPAGALVFTDVTPLEIARKVVQAIGGLLESQPDGEIVCRKVYPIGPPVYGTSGVAHSFWDRSVIGLSETISPILGFNRVVITNGPGGGGERDTLESDIIEVAGSIDDTKKHIYGYLYKERPVVLVHTGPYSTEVQALGPQVRTLVELVEIVEGRGTTRYNVNTLTSFVWKEVDLGGLTFSGRDLATTTPSYSLVEVTYTVTSVDWIVSSPLNCEIQFVLLEA